MKPCTRIRAGAIVTAIGRLYDRACPSLFSVKDGDQGIVRRVSVAQNRGIVLRHTAILEVDFGSAYVQCSHTRVRFKEQRRKKAKT